MRIAIASDLHLEFADINLVNTALDSISADVLVLAGDIMIAQDLHDHPAPGVPYDAAILKTLGSRQRRAQVYRDFIKRVAFQFPHVVAVAGNHEFYHGRWVQSLATLRTEYSTQPNVHFLERDTVVIDGVRFVGGTMWTDMNRGDPLTLHAVTDMMHDYSIIRHDGLGFTKLRPAHTVSRHRETVDYFRHVLSEYHDDQTVVVSHHAPSVLSVHEKYNGQHIMNGAYYSDLSELILDHQHIALWCHGHMHNESDYQIGDTRVVCHPRGYVGYERDDQEVDPYFVKIVEI